MVHKLTGLYSDKKGYIPKNTDHLGLEIGKDQVVLLVKDSISNKIEAIEIFELENLNSDWSDIFFEVKQQSQFLGFNFSSTNVYYNFEEALMMPLGKLSATASEEYLNLIYGNADKSLIKYDLFQGSTPFVTVYRIKQAVLDLLNRNFLLFTAQHLYTNILNDVMSRQNLPSIFLKLIIHCHHAILVFVKDGQLQLIQNFQYQSQDDLLYYSINVVQQSGLSALETQLEISGLIDLLPYFEDQLKQSFGIITYDHVPLDSIPAAGFSEYKAYHFTPFYKLMV
jgi:hypothetical protein